MPTCPATRRSTQLAGLLILLCLPLAAHAQDRTPRSEVPPAGLSTQASPAPRAPQPNELGGDDVRVANANISDRTKLAAASNGHLYLAVQHNPAFAADEYIEVYRSTNRGDQWSLVATHNPAGDDFVRLTGITIFEGNEDRVFLSYESHEVTTGKRTVRVSWADITSDPPAWNSRTVMGQAGLAFYELDIASDAVAYGSYYIYAAARGQDGDGDDIWFSRSTDFGNTWSAPYRIADLSISPYLMYAKPKVAYGQNGHVYVAFNYTERVQDTFDDGVRVVRATNFASSIANWDVGSWLLYSSSDGYDQRVLGIAANPTGPSVAVVVDDAAPGNKSRVYRSTNSGVTWTPSNENALDIHGEVAIAPDYTNGRIVAVGPYDIASAPFEDTTNWDVEGEHMETEGLTTASLAIAIEPDRPDGIALSWVASGGASDRYVWFDAEWRGGPGYPNYEQGFPLWTPPFEPGTTQVRTAPALANIDEDDEQEILFANTDGGVYAYNHDGTLVPGWPVGVGDVPWRSPVAIGDLNGDGKSVVVAGSTDGRVYCFDGAGTLMPGFPVNLGTNANTYVSIGAIGPPYHRWIVATSDQYLARISYRGELQFKSGTLNGTHMSPAAIGDVDNDGDTEIVYTAAHEEGGSIIHVLNGTLEGGVQAFRRLTEEPTGAITMADLDMDGDLEICAPTDQGILYVMHDDMSNVTGFPFDAGFGLPITAVSLDHMFGTSEPDLFFTSLDGRVHLVLYDGTEAPGFPGEMSPFWFAYGAPISTPVTPGARYLVSGSRDTGIYAFRNVSGIDAPGWPRGIEDQIEVTPAAGDIDGDGYNEIVFLGNEQLHVFDVTEGADPLHPDSWQMYGGNPARTGCMDCEEDTATAAPELTQSAFAFRQTSANPSSGPVSFAATLPGPGILAVEVFDLRGRRVRLVTRKAVDAGTHEIFFDRKDQRGAHMANGVYVARLSVRTTGKLKTLTQKFALVD